MITRKTSTGVKPVAGGVIQRWNDRIFQTTHSVEAGVDYYDLEPVANKFITGLSDYTEFQLYINSPNTTSTVKIRFNDEELTLNVEGVTIIPIGGFNGRQAIFTLNDGFAHQALPELVPEAVVESMVDQYVKFDNTTVNRNMSNQIQAIGIKTNNNDLGLTTITGDDLAEFMTMEWDL